MYLVRIPKNMMEEKIVEFFRTSAFTYEGLEVDDEDALQKMEEILLQLGYDEVPEDKRVWYWFTGKDMNDFFGLTLSNRYKDDFHFVVIPGYHNPIVKSKTRARWFDDIVSSNSIKQNAINYDIPSDFR